MFQDYGLSSSDPDVVSYPEYVHIEVVRAYLVEGKSYRQIQREVLGLPAPARGGGFVAMTLVHFYGISGNDKGLLHDGMRDEVLQAANPALKSIIDKIFESVDFGRAVTTQIEQGEFQFKDRKTEITYETKKRLSQNLLRIVVLNNYNHRCALCSISQDDLLICSHIVPWAADAENRLNPANAICLCILHDRLFDRGYLTIDQGGDVIFSAKASLSDLPIHTNQQIRRPSEYPPSELHLQYHRENIFQK